MKIVVALGGNALILPGQKGTAEEQMKNVSKTCRQLRILEEEHEIVITHGNGPQVGNLLIQQKEANGKIAEMPMDVCGAMTQGQLGYWIQQEMRNEGIHATTIVTQTLVDAEDPAFKNPTKPVGPFYTEKHEGMVMDAGRGYRKVVPSPIPVEIVEIDAIKAMIGKGLVVIASGGGGIPVVRKGGKLMGVEAVIDKDRAAQVLANEIFADVLMIPTAVDSVKINFGKKDEKEIWEMGVEDAEKHLAAGEFAEGSMKPKIEACAAFVKNGGKKAVICSIENMEKALDGRAGTTIHS
ncbi:MAG: carbamate kinase [Candidatus ainarchaeum sp.]|nr:carbamate kinase [Candidatus ainarchaeum sp.]MDD5096526.1 carbamate kinase [Candidatus ainarchaeum sp.]